MLAICTEDGIIKATEQGYDQWWLAPVAVFRETIVESGGHVWGAVSPSTLMQFGMHHVLGDGLLWYEDPSLYVIYDAYIWPAVPVFEVASNM